MSFAVKPGTLVAAHEAFGELLEVMSQLTLHCIGPMQGGGGGFLIDGFVEEIAKIRDKLMDQYGFDGPARTVFIDASQELNGLAYDYREADTTAAERSDAQLAKVDDPAPEFTTSVWSEGVMSDGDTYVSVSNYGDLLGGTTSSFEDYSEWKKITDTVSDIAGMDWMTDWLPNFGFEDPVPKILKTMQGDWEGLGRAINAIEVAGDAWVRIAEDIAGIWQALSKDWSGNAADACYAFLSELHTAALEHGNDVRDQAKHLHSLAQSTYFEVDALRTAVELIGDLIPNPLDLGWWADNLLPNKIAGRIVQYIAHIDAIMGLCGEPFKFFENIGFDESAIDLELPQLSYSAPEVPH